MLEQAWLAYFKMKQTIFSQTTNQTLQNKMEGGN